LLAPLADKEVRHNFSAVAKDGRVDVDLTVVQGKNQNEGTTISAGVRKRVTVYIKAKDGRVRARLVCFFHGLVSHSPVLTPSATQHDPPPSFPLPRPSISLIMHAHDGSVSLSLPRSFIGPLNITTRDGSVHFSPDTAVAITTFTQSAKTRKYFVGDYSSWRDGNAWLGDEAVLDVDDGSVRIQFDDEVLESPKGFWAKLFGQY
jgi:hypothetical protein